MQVRTAQSRYSRPDVAVADLAARLDVDGLGRPDFVALHFAVGLDAAAVHAAAAGAFGAGALHGGSSCLGVMGSDGVDLGGAGIGAFAVWDRDGCYGTASAGLDADAETAAGNAARAALARAGRPGEMPDLVWLTVAPGREEQVLAGVRSVVGSRTVIVGGSAADNDVTGQWAQFGPGALHRDGLVVSVLFPSRPIASVYQSGYTPTDRSGHVTRVRGRRLIEIDGRPAAAVLHEWSGGKVPMAGAAPRAILADATLWPLGRVMRHVAGVPFHLLAHPATAHPDGSVDLFADVDPGDRLWQMQGTADGLVARAGRVAARARAAAGGRVSGALVIYCGGCMLAVRDRMDEVARDITLALGAGTPWLGVFSFGEQGMVSGDGVRHGNLMVSCSVLAGPDA